MYYTETKDYIDFEQILPGYYVIKDRPNMGVIITNEGVIVIDTLLKKSLAKEVKKAIREITDLPIKYLIYTHSHFDHVNAASEYVEDGTQIIANETVRKNFDQYRLLANYYQMVSDVQFDGQEGADIDFDFIYPTIDVHDYYEFSLGGKTVQITNTQGETDDHCFVYIPEDKVVFVGDQCTCSFPNIGTPFRPNRDEVYWEQSMKDIMKLNAEIMVPGHRDVVFGKDLIKDMLSAMAECLHDLHEKVAEAVDRNCSLEEALNTVELTDSVKNNVYVQDHYGCLDFAVRGIYRRMTGWFDFNPANLENFSEKDLLKTVIDMIPDKTVIVEHIVDNYKKGEPVIAMRLISMLEKAGYEDDVPTGLKQEILTALAAKAPNRIQQNIYHYYEHIGKETR